MLHDQKGIQDWNEIARLAHEEYHMPLKSPKLYKERLLAHDLGTLTI